MSKREELTKLEEELKNKQVYACEVYSRIVGYYRPVNQFNLGKKEEHANRVNFKVN